MATVSATRLLIAVTQGSAAINAVLNKANWAITACRNLATISQTSTLSVVAVRLGGQVTATSGTISGSTGFTVVSL